jgi:hypothetical protein
MDKASAEDILSPQKAQQRIRNPHLGPQSQIVPMTFECIALRHIFCCHFHV